MLHIYQQVYKLNYLFYIYFSGITACCLWDACNDNAIKATKSNFKEYLKYMQNISAINNDNTFNNIQHLPNIEQINNHNEEVSTTRMGIDLLRAEHFSQLDVNAHGVYANGLDWSYSKALCSKIWKKMKF